MSQHSSWWPRAALAALLSVAVAAGCGGGGGGGSKGSSDSESLDPKTSALTDDDIRHFLSRTRFASNEIELANVKAAGLDSYVDAMLIFQTSTAVENQALNEVALINPSFDPNFPNRNDLRYYWEYILINNPNAFQEVMAMFWHDHFGVSSDVLGREEGWWMFSHIRLLRSANAVGSLTDFMYDVSTDWAMLRFLDGLNSQRGRPNENFARELWELFTLGRDNGYTQVDIEEAARSLTGYRALTNPLPVDNRYVVFEANRHDPTDKTIFGTLLPGRSGANGFLEYRDLIDLTFTQRPAREFITTKLFEYFVYKNPSQNVVDELVTILQSNNDNVGPLLKTIFLSKAFYSAKGQEGIVKNPVDHTIGFIRATGLRIRLNGFRWLDDYLFNMGMQPTQPPSVNGWPEGSLWLSSAAMVERANVIHRAITERSISVDPLLPPPAQRSSAEVVDELTNLMRLKLATVERTEYINYLDTNRDAAGNVFSDPFDGNDPIHVDERVRGLLYVMAQHPTYHIR
ncbi:MAG: DUF1800 family protein [Planctomycetota bacterium]|nr:DUF1800 family protein [Planctomycetota bacterium]